MHGRASAAPLFRLILVWLVIFGGMYLASLYDFHLFHSLAELFSIVVACGIFVVAWNTRSFGRSPFLLFLGIAYLNVGVLDFLHTATYKGMGIMPGLGPDPPIQLWIAARYMEAISLLAAPLFSRRQFPPRALLAVYGVVCGGLIMAIFSGWFPSCYQEGTGVTAFKTISEYLISLVLLAAIGLLLQRRRDFPPQVLRMMIGACGLTILAELSLSSFTTLFGFANQLCLYLKILSFFLIYRATIQASLSQPYEVLFRDLKAREQALSESESRIRALLHHTAAAVIFLAPDFKVHEFNSGAQKVFGWQRSEMLNHNFLARMIPAEEQNAVRQTLEHTLQGSVQSGLETLMLNKAGEEKVLLWNSSPLHDAAGQALGVIISGQDITARILIEEERERLIESLQAALKEISTLSGLLPICANCKKVRDDSGYWRQIESYIQEHSRAQFSHGICPECAKKLYPDLYKK